MKLKVMEDIQFLILDSGHQLLETKTILSGSRNKLKIEELITRIFKASYQLLAQPLTTTLHQILALTVMEIVTPLLLPLLALAAVLPVVLQLNNKTLLTKTVLELPLKVLRLISLTFKLPLRSRKMKRTMIVMRKRKKKSDTFKSSNYNKYLRNLPNQSINYYH